MMVEEGILGTVRLFSTILVFFFLPNLSLITSTSR